MIGIKSPETLAAASVRNDATFITILTLVASVIAVATSYLPGDWGFFVPYLSGRVGGWGTRNGGFGIIGAFA